MPEVVELYQKSSHAAGNLAASAPASVAAGPAPGAPYPEAASAAGLTISQNRACMQFAYCAVIMVATSAVQIHINACLTLILKLTQHAKLDHTHCLQTCDADNM